VAQETSFSGEVLSARKREILRRVIHHYVREVHPISSKSIAREIQLSSATVRNELAALEEQGYLNQLHTSGGRVPTDRAYRFFVEELLDKLSYTIGQRSKVAHVYRELGQETEALLEGTLDLLTQMTGYVSWVSMPTPTALDIRSISFVEVSAHEILVVLITGAGAIQSRLVQSELTVKELRLGQLAEVLNNYLRGRSVTDVDYEELRAVFRQQVNVPDSMLSTLQEFFSDLACGGERVLFSNALQLALQPEFTEVKRLSNIINVLQNRERFIRILRNQLSERDVQTIIGTENLDPALHDCSLVLSSYDVPGGGDGTVGILGPTRLFYDRALPWVRLIGEAVAQALKDVGREGDES